jgi:hypothetical protein
VRLGPFKSGAALDCFTIVCSKADLIVAKTGLMKIVDSFLSVTAALKGANDSCAITYWHELYPSSVFIVYE